MKNGYPQGGTIITREHLLRYGFLALDVLQQVLEAKLGHLQKERKVLTWVWMWVWMCVLKFKEHEVNGGVTYLSGLDECM